MIISHRDGGFIMISIGKPFEQLLHKYKYIPDVNSVKEKVYRYRLAIQKESPRLKSQEIHVIGMAHKINPGEENWSPLTQGDIIGSQKKMVEFLNQVTPTLVGIEGFSGEKFSFRNAIIEGFKIHGMQCYEHDISKHTEQMQNHPQQKDFWDYIANNPQVEFCGVEDFELHRLQNKIWKGMIPIHLSDFEGFMNGLVRLRGILMMVKLSRQIRKNSHERGALPVGFLHLREIIEYKDYLNADWLIHNATKFSGPALL